MYYLISHDDGIILESLDTLPNTKRLTDMASEYRCGFYIIQGEHTGIEVVPADKSRACPLCSGFGETRDGEICTRCHGEGVV